MNDNTLNNAQATINILTSTEDLKEAIEASEGQRVYLFKHSDRCGISHQAYEAFTQFADNHNCPCFLVEVNNHREVSDEIRDQLGKPHHSPQVLVIEGGEVLNHATHYVINYKWLVKAKF